MALAGTASCGESKLRGIAVDPPRAAPPLVVRRDDGSTFDLARERGRVVLLFFGYTHCPDICPTTLADWRKVKRALGADSARARFVFVSVDPARDSPRVAQAYAAQFDAGFIGLSPDSTDLPAIQYGFGVTSTREAGTGASGYLVSHASQAFLVAPDGQLRLLYSFGASPEDVVADIRELLP
ncbi:MAG: SCO family protein [Gemmatimonadaceae bacterium]|nr:SCO family protein [Gemmatimonadaceae bacterium]